MKNKSAMAESDPVSTIKLAKELVEQSCGLAMDLGKYITTMPFGTAFKEHCP